MDQGTVTGSGAHGAVSPPPRNVGPGFEKPKHERTGPEGPPPGLVPRARFFLEDFGHMMSRIVLTALYAVLVAPVALFYRWLADPFQSRWRGSSFRPWRSRNDTLDRARRQG